MYQRARSRSSALLLGFVLTKQLSSNYPKQARVNSDTRLNWDN